MLPLPRGAVWQALFLLCAVLFLREVRSEGRVVCYYTNWSVYRPGTAKFNPQNINPYLCTHLVYAFGGFTKDNQMKPFDKYQDIEQGGYAKFTGLKTYNKQLKTMIAIGGWNEASSRFSPLVANPERRQQFIKNILKFLRQNHFDGIDLDWEYPAHRQGGKPRDRDNYAQFVEELRAEFERESEKTGRPRLLLTMAVPAGIEYIDKGYDIPKLNKYLDWFNLLTYDFHSSHEPSANHHAPLYSLEEESEYNYDTELNIDYSVKYYLKAGADRDKLVLGIPTYGRSFTLINEESTEIGAPSEGPGEQGDATREKGYLAYYEICQNLKEDPEWTVVQPNPNAMGPYAYRRNQWVGYDDEEIVRKKAQYAVEHGLGGIMFWAIDNDDFRGTCTGKPYPLIEAAKEAMLDSLGLGINEVAKPSGAPKKPLRSRSRENISRNRINSAGEKSTFNDRKENARRTTTAPRKTTTTTTEAPRTTTIKLTEAEGSSLYIGGRTTTPPPPTTPDPGTDFKCEEEGFFQHPRDCKKYYWCLDSGPSGLGIVAHQFTCPSGLYFNPAADSCDFARNVPCKTKKSTTAAPVATTTTTTTTPRPTSSYNRITAATSRNSFLRTTTKRTTTTTTTTTAAPPVEEEIEYEDEDEEQKNSNSNKDRDPEEDPKVIQELIDLIRKLGGIEELEKYLSRKEDGSIALKEQTSSNSAAKSSGIAKTVYEKVVSRPNTYNSFRNRLQSSTLYKKTGLVETSSSPSNFDAEDEEESGGLTSSSNSGSSYSKYSSVVRGNSRQGPQNEGLEKLPEFDAFIKEKKQYVTINRNRGSFKAQQGAEEVADEDDVDDEDEILDEEIVNTSRKSSGNGVTYSTIRRTKTKTVKTTTEEDIKRQEEERLRIEQENNEKKIYATLNRTRGRYPTTEQPSTVASDEIISTTNRYKYFERTRPTKSTTTITITDADELEANVNDDEDDQEDDAEKEQENVMVHILSQSEESTQKPSQTTRLYASIGRKTKTTTATKTTIAPTESTFVTNQSEKTTEPTPEPISTTATPITASSTTTTATATNQPEIITTTNHPIASSSNHILSNSATSSLNDVDSSALFDTTTSTNVPNIILSSSDSKESSHQNTIDKNTNLAHDTQSTAVTGVETTSSNQDESENSAKIKTTTRTTTKTLTTTGTTDADDDLSSVDNDEKVTNLSKNITRTQYKYIRTRVPTNKTITTTTNDQNESTTNTRTRTTTTTTTTTNNQSIQNNLNSDNGKGVNNISVKYSGGGRRQQANVKSPLQTQQTAPTTTATTPTTEPTSSFKPFLGTVSSPRPFGFPIRRTRPSSTTTTTETNNILSTVEQLSDADEASSSIKSSSEQTKKKYQSNRSRTASAARTRTSSRFSTAQQQQSSNQNEVRETTSLPNNSKDQVNELNEDTRSTVGSSTTTESTTRISSRPSVRPTSRRIRVLKYRRPVGSNNVTLVDSKQINDTNSSTSSVTNSIDTSLDLSVNEPSSVVSNYENTNSENTQTQNSETTQTQTAAQSHRTQTTNTSETPANQNVTPTKRFRKVVRKLIRPVQKSTTEGVVLEVESSTVATIETTTATSIPASASTRRSGSRFNLKNYLAEKAGTPIDEENKKIVAPTTTSRSRNGYSRRKNLNFNKAEANNDEETNEQNIITTSPRGRTRFSIASLSSTTTEQIPKAFTRAPLFGGRSRFTGYTVATSTTEASDIEEEFDDSLAAVLTEADVNEDAQYEDTIASTTERAIIQQEIWESKTVVADEVNGQSKRPGIPLTTPIIVASIEEENDELTTDDETLDDVEETTGEAVGIISSSVVTENALEIESKLNEETNNNATSTVLSEDTQAITDELKTDIKEVISEESLSTSLQQSSGETKGLNASQLEEVVEEPIKNVRLPKLLRENALTISTSNTVDESGESNESQTAVNDENETTSATSTRKPFIPASKLKALQAESKTTSSDDVSNETTTPASIVRPTFRRKLISKRPYSPTRPSFLPISTTKQPSSFQPKRIFGRRKYGQFGKTNGDEEDDESIRTKTTLITSRVPAYKRFRPQNNQRNEFNEEEEQPVKAVIARPPGLFSRQKILTATTEEELTDENENEEEEQIDDEENEEEGDDNDDEEEEDEDNNDVVAEIDEDEDEENIQITTELPALDLETTDASTTEAPTKHIVNVPFNPNYRKPPSFKNRPGSQSNRFGSTDLNSSGRPTNRPHVINQPHGAYETTPTALQIEEEAVDDEETTVTPDDEDSINTKVTKSRTYERKFGIQSTTELSSGSGENAVKTIEDLDIEALNARNKKIFESHSKKHTTPKIFTTTTTTSTTTTEQELQEQEQEQQPPPQEAPQFTKQNTETENDDAYDSSYSDGHQNGFITTTPATPTSHNIEHNTIIRTKTNSNQISSQDNEGWTTSTPPTTTLLHVFTLTDEDEQTSQPPTESEHQGAILLPERGEPKHKVIEINRIVEITSKEEKLRRKSKGNNDFTKVAPATLKVESFPHLEPLGEISVVKYVHLVNGDDILVDGHSSVADYTPTDASFTSNSIPVRNSLPDGSSSHDYAQLNSASANTHEIATVRSRLEERYGKALVPEVIREAVETSTISLEGLFDSSRKGKKLDSGEDTFNELSIETKKNKQDLDVRTTIIEAQTGVPSSISVVRELLPETTTLASIIDSAITSGEASVYVENNVISTNTESTTIESILSDSITPPATSIETTTAEPTTTESSTTESTSTTQSTTTESTLSTVAATESNILSETPTTTESVTYVKATPVPVALFPTYVRPIVPLLRPESNESSPLVISIANLDKVILSKVMKTDTESTPSPTVATTTTSTTEFTPVSDSSAEFSNHNAAILEIPTNSQKTHTDSHTDSSGVTIVLAKTLGDSQVGSSVVDVSNASGLSQNNLNTNTVKIVNENEVEVNSQSSVSDSSNDSKSVKEVVSFSSETHVVHRKKKGRKRKGKKSHKLRTTTPRPIETTTINEVDDRAIVITPVKEIYNRAIEMTPVKEVDDRAIEMTPVKEVDDSAIETTTIKEVDDSAIKTTDIKGVDDSAIETTTIKEVDDRAIEMTDINEVDDSAFETTTLSEASDLAIETATVYEANDSAIEMTTLTSEADDVETSTKAQLRTQTVAISRRPVLSVRRRLINSPTTAAATITTLASSVYNDFNTAPAAAAATTESQLPETTSKFNIYTNNNNNRRNRPAGIQTTTYSSAITTTTAAATKYPNKNIYNQQLNGKHKTKSSAAAADLNVSSSSSSSSSASVNDISQNQLNQQQQQQENKYNSSPALRRKFQQRRIITTTTTSPTDEADSEQQRTQNPLFKRRYSFLSTTPRPLPVTLTNSPALSTFSPHDALTTTLFVDGLDNDDNTDQIAKSSIHSNLFNRIPDEGEDDNDNDNDEVNKKLIPSAIKTTRRTTTTAPTTPSPAETSQQFVESITRRMDTFANIRNGNTITTRKPNSRRRPQLTTPNPVPLPTSAPARRGGSAAFANRRRPHKVAEPYERLNGNQSPIAEKQQLKLKDDVPARTYRPNVDYDYYDDEDVRVVGNTAGQQLKVILHGGGIIECLDQGNFPHPLSCRKFISCAKFETGGVVGWEYTCPKGLSYDPVGGMCNWAAGLGCKE